MGRIGSLLMGIILGAAGLYTALSFHILRAEDGHHFIPKQSLNFNDCYLDIREFTVSDWSDHATLAQDIMKADRGELLKEAAQASLQNTIGEIFQSRRR